MAIAVTATKTTLCNTYVGLGTYIGLATGNPGSSATPSNEVTGGSPAYARVATTWGSTSAGANTGSAVTINCPTATVTYVLLASAGSGNNMIDNTLLSTSIVMSQQGQIVVTPTYTQT